MVPSIETLPVELFHRIFDNLDAQTILFSIRSVCRLFQSVVNTYDRYVLDFKLISKSDFYPLCHLIPPSKVISLTLSNDDRTSDQINLFISLVRLRQFTRLRSLTLLQIDESQLNFMLKQIKFNFLTSFSFSIRKYDDRHKNTTINLLSSTIAHSTLRKLQFDMSSDRMLKILWAISCTIQYLTINNHINADDLYKILQCCPHLHTLIMNEIPTAVINNLTSICFRHLTSLTIEKLDVTIDKVESFLLLTPSLVYLKLVGGKQMMDGKRWKEFIEINLSQLAKFEFYFTEWRSTIQTLADVELIIASFQTPFWIEHKKWFITCECPNEYPKTVYLSSLPFCKSSMYYLPKSEKHSLSTYRMMTNNGLPMIDNIRSLGLTLNKSMADDIQEKVCYSN